MSLKSNFIDTTLYMKFAVVALLTSLLSGGNYLGWFLSMLTTYFIMVNNSIQTVGFFTASNKQNNKINTFYFLSVVFVVTMLFSWLCYKRELHFLLLNRTRYNPHLSIFLLLLPVIIDILTKLRMPLSAAFLVIPVFSDSGTVKGMVTKTFMSYVLAFVVSFLAWKIIYTLFRGHVRVKKDEQIGKVWIFMEYIFTGAVWAMWLTISACNFVVFLLRVFVLKDFILFLFMGILCIYLMVYNGGGEMLKIIEDKSDVDIKNTTIFNALLSITMLIIRCVSKIPITSTWMFLGTMAGRELAVASSSAVSKYKSCYKKILIDLKLAIFGIVLSLITVEILLFVINLFNK